MVQMDIHRGMRVLLGVLLFLNGLTHLGTDPWFFCLSALLSILLIARNLTARSRAFVNRHFVTLGAILTLATAGGTHILFTQDKIGLSLMMGVATIFAGEYVLRESRS